MRLKNNVLAVVSILMCSSVGVNAATVEMPISNYSFELNSGWTFDYGSIFEPSGEFIASEYPSGSIPNGLRMIQLGDTGKPGRARQFLPATLQPNCTYTVTAYIGERWNSKFFGGSQYVGMCLRVVEANVPLIGKTWTGAPYNTNDIPLIDDATDGTFTPVTLTVTTGTGLSGDPLLVAGPNSTSVYGKQMLLDLEAGDITLDFDKVSASVTNSAITPVSVTINTIPTGISTVDILGTHSYAQGSELDLNATWLINCPDTVYRFKQWKVDGTVYDSNSAAKFVINASQTITAEFESRGGCTTFEPVVLTTDSGFESPQWGDSQWQEVAADGWASYGKYINGWNSYQAFADYPAHGEVIHFKQSANGAGWEWRFPGVSQTPYGNQIAWLNTGGGWSQPLNVSLQSGTTYTIKLDVGMPSNRGYDGWYHVQLLAGESILFTAGVNMATNPPTISGYDNGAELTDLGQTALVANNWVSQTLTYNSGSNQNAGKPLTVRVYGGPLTVDNVVVTQGSIVGVPVYLTMSTPGDTNSVVPSKGQHVYPYGTTVLIKASDFASCPNVYNFSKWLGGVAEPNNAATSVMLNDDKTVTAVYVEGISQCGDQCHPINQFFDANKDCKVDFQDFAAMAERWQAGAINLLQNPGFEDGIGYPWGADGSTITLSTDAHTGLYSADVYYPSDYKAIFQEIGGISESGRLTDYTVTYSVKAATQDDVGVLIWCGVWEHVPRDPWWVFHNGDMHALTAGWQTYTSKFTLTESDTDAFRTVIQAAVNAPGNFRVDDVSVAKEYDNSDGLFDANTDNKIDFADVAIFAGAWLDCTTIDCLN